MQIKTLEEYSQAMSSIFDWIIDDLRRINDSADSYLKTGSLVEDLLKTTGNVVPLWERRVQKFIRDYGEFKTEVLQDWKELKRASAHLPPETKPAIWQLNLELYKDQVSSQFEELRSRANTYLQKLDELAMDKDTKFKYGLSLTTISKTAPEDLFSLWEQTVRVDK